MRKVTVAIACLLCFSPVAWANLCALPEALAGQGGKKQTIPFAKDKVMHIEQWITTETVKPHSAVLATNITCQKMEGIAYTGSREEWYGLMNAIAKGFVQKQAKDIELTLVGEDDATYKGNQAHQEYTLTADLDGNKQLVRNITWLDFDANTALTVSVSGNEVIAAQINEQYSNVIEAIRR